MANERDDQQLIDEASTAYRPTDPDGSVRLHPAWLDLSPDGRERLFDETLKLRELEKALDSKGLSTTAKAVIARIRGG